MKILRPFASLALALLLVSGLARADAVLDWNDAALKALLAARQPPPSGARSLAMMHVAMFDAANAAEPRYRPYAFAEKDPGASAEAAANAAAHAVLSSLFPDQAAAFDASYATAMAAIPEGDAKARGIALGKKAAAMCVSMRTGDGASAFGPYRQKVVPGVYVPTVYPVSSEWAKVKPWFMRDPAQFRPGPPPALDSAVWARDRDEIRAVGGRASKTRDAQQTDIARFWALVGPPSWNPVVRGVAQSRPQSLVERARLFAMVNMAASDALVAVFDAKYKYDFWRPVTAIRYEELEPEWLPLVDTPMHPEYPCAHCISSTAVATVLQAQFGDEIPPVSMTSPTAPGVTRTWRRIGDYAQEVNNARIWSGVHYRNSTEVGAQMGRKIGELATTQFMQPLQSAPAR